MTHEPFLRVPVRSCRGLVHARHRARQIAQLLRFGQEEITCIAAGAFAVAAEARTRLRRAYLCFGVVDRHLIVFAQSMRRRGPVPEGLLILQKPLPAGDQRLAGEDLAWIVRQVQLLAPTSLAEEIIRQNQETLELLSALQIFRKNVRRGENPSAA